MVRTSRCTLRAQRVSGRRGAALLEVLIGLTVLAIAGVALLALLSQATDGVHRQHLRDVETRAASACLDAVALWTREQLDARMGSSPLADWTLHVAPLTHTVYRVALANRATGSLVLETALYRPDPADEHRH